MVFSKLLANICDDLDKIKRRSTVAIVKKSHSAACRQKIGGKVATREIKALRSDSEGFFRCRNKKPAGFCPAGNFFVVRQAFGWIVPLWYACKSLCRPIISSRMPWPWSVSPIVMRRDKISTISVVNSKFMLSVELCRFDTLVKACAGQ